MRETTYLGLLIEPVCAFELLGEVLGLRLRERERVREY